MSQFLFRIKIFTSITGHFFAKKGHESWSICILENKNAKMVRRTKWSQSCAWRTENFFRQPESDLCCHMASSSHNELTLECWSAIWSIWKVWFCNDSGSNFSQNKNSWILLHHDQFQLTVSRTCWGWNIQGELCQYHHCCWCPDSLYHQDISNLDIDYVRLTDPSF